MEINKELLTKQMIKVKKIIASMYHYEDKEKLTYLQILNKEVCLVVAGFKCQKCSNEENLQLHHLIMRRAKDYMDFYRYASQRYYWANAIILCDKCHNSYHSRLGKDVGEGRFCITQDKMKEIKKKYGNNN